jgi:hypothetical protein
MCPVKLTPMILQVLHSTLVVWLSGGVVGGSYVTPKPHSWLDVTVDGIHRVYQPSINLYK